MLKLIWKKIRILPIFKVLKKFGDLEDDDMLRTFNMGVGIIAVIKEEFVQMAVKHLKTSGVETYEIGVIREGDKSVDFYNGLLWQ